MKRLFAPVAFTIAAALAVTTDAATLDIDSGPVFAEADGEAFNLPGVLDFVLTAENGVTFDEPGLDDLSILLTAELVDDETAQNAALTVFRGAETVVSSDDLVAFAANIGGADDTFAFQFGAVDGVEAARFANGLVARVTGGFGPDPFGAGFGVIELVDVSFELAPVLDVAVPLPPTVWMMLGSILGVGWIGRTRRRQAASPAPVDGPGGREPRS
ncbi:MAG: hypothetical protein AAGE83_16375 [Pseudomonadota bacterium]